MFNFINFLELKNENVGSKAVCMFDEFNISPKGTDAKGKIKLACFPLIKKWR